jgi:hypothetical protein
MRGIAITVAVAALTGAVACGPPKNRTEDLLASVRTYQDGLRWERFSNAASRVPPAERDQFLDEREDLIDDLHITNYELVKVEAAEHDVARIEVKYTWYRDAEGTVQHTRAVETWEKHGRVWLLVEEHRRHGPEMPGLPEPRDDAGAAAGAEAAADAAADPAAGPAAGPADRGPADDGGPALP